MSSELFLAVAGNAAGAGEGEYIEDLFSTYLYEGNGGTQSIQNGIALGSGDPVISLQGYTFTSIGSAIHSSYPLSNINDGVAETSNGQNLTYVSNGNFDVYVDLQTPQTVVAYLIAPQGGGGQVYNTPLNFKVHGSSDGSNWTEIEFFSNVSAGSSNWTAGTYREFSFTNTTAYRYWRFDHIGDGSNGSGVAISELQFKLDGGDAEAQGGLVWIKNRVQPDFNVLADTNRGANSYLVSSNTAAPNTNSGYVTGFNSNGFSIGSALQVNTSTEDYASWTFRKAPKFFDVVTYTGSGSVGQQVSHNLGSRPGFILVKRIDSTSNWFVIHTGPSGDMSDAITGISLNSPSAANYSSLNYTSYHTDTFFSPYRILDQSNNRPYTSGATYVAYLFAHNDGDGGFGENADQDIIKCGSYTGGTAPISVDLGFEPQWILIKGAVGSTQNWVLFDIMRGIATGATDEYLSPNVTDAETTFSTDYIDVTSTGFEIKQSNNAFVSQNSATYIYIAIRRGPMKTPENVSDAYHLEPVASLSTGVDVYCPFPPDLLIERERTTTQNTFWVSRLTEEYFYGVSNGNGFWSFDGTNGQVSAGGNRTDNPYHYQFRRSPGFMDVVTYTTNGSAQTVNHNLGVVPEMMLFFNRIGTGNADYWVGDAGNNRLTPYGATTASTTDNNFFGADPTSTTFRVGTATRLNEGTGNAYDVFMFATLAGISKVGTFSHTSGTATDVDCGFSNGASFVLWRRYDGQDESRLFDSTRGIVSGSDPYFELRYAGAEKNADLIDPLSSGFTVSADSGNDTGNYLFLAIA